MLEPISYLTRAQQGPLPSWCILLLERPGAKSFANDQVEDRVVITRAVFSLRFVESKPQDLSISSPGARAQNTEYWPQNCWQCSVKGRKPSFIPDGIIFGLHDKHFLFLQELFAFRNTIAICFLFVDGLCACGPRLSCLQRLLKVSCDFVAEHENGFNCTKIVGAVFPSKKFKQLPTPFVSVMAHALFVDKIKHLGVLLHTSLEHNNDTHMKVEPLHCAVDKLRTTFAQCSTAGKNLFRAYCMPVYACQWSCGYIQSSNACALPTSADNSACRTCVTSQDTYVFAHINLS